MTFRLEDPEHEFFTPQGFFFRHGLGSRTLAVLGVLPMLRRLELDGVVGVNAFEWTAECFDERGMSLRKMSFRTERDEEMVFDSNNLFESAERAPEMLVGYARLTVDTLILLSHPEVLPAKSRRNFNGVFTIYRPGLFVTGVHMYHGVSFFSWRALAKHYVKSMVQAIFRRISRLGAPDSVWKGDAVGAVAVHSTMDAGTGIAIMHSENWYPGFSAEMEFRHETGVTSRYSIPNIPPGGTYKARMPTRSKEAGAWAQALCIDPPLGMSRFLAGEEFSDGSLTLDHAYFQQPSHSQWGKEQEVLFFPRKVLSESVIGPSNPWFCIHNDDVESLIAISNQFHPQNEYKYDLLVFAEDGQLVLRKREFCIVPPWGFAVPSISEALRVAGIKQFRGTYMLAYSATNQHEMLPSRLHIQGIYRFGGEYWNGVQGDAFVWSSPAKPVPEIEALTSATRKRQLWYSPVVDNKDIETLISIANLSYSLDYTAEQTLYLRYCRGGNLISEREITLRPFGATLISVREYFGDFLHASGQGGTEYGEVVIYPKTGKTFCAAYMLREVKTRRFFLEHVLSIPKYDSEH